jgi:hypothetical protein
LLLLGVDGVSVGLGSASLLLQPDLLFSGLQPFGLRALLGRLGGRLLRGPLLFGLCLGLLLLHLRPVFRLMALALGPSLALLLGDLILQTLALELDFGLLASESGLVLSLLSLLRLAVGLALGVGLRLLEAAFAGELLIAGCRPGRFLHFSGKLSEQPASRSLSQS